MKGKPEENRSASDPLLDPDNDDFERRERKRKRKIVLMVGLSIVGVAFIIFLDSIVNIISRWQARSDRKVKQDAQQALGEANPAYREMSFRQSEDKINIGRLEDAKNLLLAYISRDPNNAEAHYRLGKVYLRLGQTQIAYDYLKQALKLREDYPEALYQLGEIYLSGRDLNEAKKVAAQLRKVGGHVREGLMLESEISLAEGQTGTALQKALEAQKESSAPMEVKWIAYIADLHLKNKQPQQAKDMIAKMQPANMDAEDLLNLAKFYHVSGDKERADAYFQETVRQYPRNPEAHYTFGEYLIVRGKYPEAIAHFKQAFEILPDAQVIEYKIGEALVAAGKVDELPGLIRTMLTKDPRNVFALRLKTRLHIIKGQRQEAIATLQEMIKISPYGTAPHIFLAGLYLQEGKLNSAAHHAKRALDLGDRSISPHVLLAGVAFKEGQHALARDHLLAVLAKEPNYLPALLQLGDVYLNLGQYKLAEEQYGKAIAYYPSIKSIKTKLAWLKAMKGDTDAALSLSRQYWREMPEDENAIVGYVNALMLRNRPNEALAVVLIQTRKKPDDWRFQYVLGDIYLLKGEKRQALNSYQRALKLNAEDVNLALQLSSRFAENALDGEAVDVLEKTLKRFPRNVLAANQLAWLYVDHLKTPEKAAPLISWLQNVRNDPAVMDTVGWYFFQIHDYRQAAYHFNEALRLEPKNAVIRNRLNMTIEKLKKPGTP